MVSNLSLAYLGAPPLFEEKLFVGRPNIGNRQVLRERLDDILERRWLSNNGVYVQAFERKIEHMLGVKHAIAICNGTVALEILIKALDLSGEVILPSFTFIATAHAVRWLGLKPVFCDIDPLTHTLDPQSVESLITPVTSAILGVHVWGTPCPVTALQEIAERHQLKLLFDAAHAFGCGLNGQMIGSFGDAEVFSFHATKFVNSLEGGVITTNNDELAARIRLMKNFGFTAMDQVGELGTNGKMNEMAAAMGLTSLESQDDFIATNRQHFAQYQSALAQIPGLTVYQSTTHPQNYQYIVVRVDSAITGLTRDQWVELLHAENVIARRYFYPGCHRMAPYLTEQPAAGGHLPHTEELSEHVMILPTGTGVTEADIAKITQWLALVCAQGRSIAVQMA